MRPLCGSYTNELPTSASGITGAAITGSGVTLWVGADVAPLAPLKRAALLVLGSEESMKIDHRFFSLFEFHAPIVEYPSCIENSYGVGNSGAIRDRVSGWCLELNITRVGK